MIIVFDQRSSRSIQRYTRFLIDIFQPIEIKIPSRNPRLIALFYKYIILPVKLLLAKDKDIILPSEKLSFLMYILPFKNFTVFVHDLHDLMSPEVSNQRKRFEKILLNGLKYSRTIISISQSTKKDLIYYFPRLKDRNIEVIHNPIELSWCQEAVLPNEDFQSIIPNYFVLIVGSNAWYKNIEWVLNEISNLKLNIVKIGDLPLSYKDYSGNLNIIQLSDISDQELHWLYQQARCLLFPSLHEGFGWPLAEAMAAGCPIIASRNSSIPEVCENAALYFNTGDVEELKKHLLTLYSDNPLREELIQKGQDVVKRFNYERFKHKTYSLIYSNA